MKQVLNPSYVAALLGLSLFACDKAVNTNSLAPEKASPAFNFDPGASIPANSILALRINEDHRIDTFLESILAERAQQNPEFKSVNIDRLIAKAALLKLPIGLRFKKQEGEMSVFYGNEEGKFKKGDLIIFADKEALLKLADLSLEANQEINKEQIDLWQSRLAQSANLILTELHTQSVKDFEMSFAKFKADYFKAGMKLSTAQESGLDKVFAVNLGLRTANDKDPDRATIDKLVDMFGELLKEVNPGAKLSLNSRHNKYLLPDPKDLKKLLNQLRDNPEFNKKFFDAWDKVKKPKTQRDHLDDCLGKLKTFYFK